MAVTNAAPSNRAAKNLTRSNRNAKLMKDDFNTKSSNLSTQHKKQVAYVSDVCESLHLIDPRDSTPIKYAVKLHALGEN
jgi:hypothetical protein